MFDLISRIVLLSGSVLVLVRAFILVHSSAVQTPGRRLAVSVQIPAALTWTWFQFDLLLTTPVIEGPLVREAFISRIALFLTLVGWIVMQQVIVYSEREK